MAFHRVRARYNHAMRSRTAVTATVLQILSLAIALICTAACTVYGERPPHSMAEATGGEGLERIFWKNVQARNWVELERSLASNYSGVSASGALDRSATIDQYRTWQLQDYAIGDLKTELNGSTLVVTYNITLNGGISNGTAGSQRLPSAPQHMMTVWQQQKAGWVVIAHSVSSQ
jgi:hypothetical protein